MTSELTDPVAPSFVPTILPLALAQTLVWAGVFYMFPAMLLTFERELGWSKPELTGAFTLALVVSAICAPLSGRLVDKGYGRIVLSGASACSALLVAALSQVNTLWQFYLVWFGLGVCMSSALYETCFAIFIHCFGKLAKRPITLTSLIAGFAGTLAFPSATILVGWIGWRETLIVFAAFILFFAVPLNLWGCSKIPGLSANATQGAATLSKPSNVLYQRAFWLLALTIFGAAAAHGFLTTHLLPLLDSRAVPAHLAVAAAASVGPMQVVGRILMMTTEARLRALIIYAACLISMAAGSILLLFAGNTIALIALFILLHGAGWGVISIVRPLVVAEVLGTDNFGSVSGMLAIPFMSATAAAPSVGAVLWSLGGYDTMLVAGIISVFTALGALVLADRCRPTVN